MLTQFVHMSKIHLNKVSIAYCPIVLLFLKGRKHFNSIVFKSQFYFKVPQTIRLNVTRYFVMKTPTKREFEQIASNHW